MSYQEATPRVYHGFPFHATDEQARRILAQLHATTEYRRWHVADSLIRTHHVCAETRDMLDVHLRAARLTAVELAEAEAALSVVLVRLITAELGE